MTATQTPRRQKRLYKDPNDKIIAGVASGVAKYFDVDTTLVRVIWVCSVIFAGFGILPYLLLWLILEDEPQPETGAGPETFDIETGNTGDYS
jgi:phage shock protein PspC (stress-responsive transcriptional regulator)